MARLRVPIDLLQQAIYPGGQRLGKFKPWTPPVTRSSQPDLQDIRSRVISPGVRVFASGTGWFSRSPYLSRFFFQNPSRSSLTCRCCNNVVYEDSQFDYHRKHCYPVINIALRNLISEEICPVCRREMKTQLTIGAMGDKMPVCSDNCLKTWQIFNPSLMKDEVSETAKHFVYVGESE